MSGRYGAVPDRRRRGGRRAARRQRADADEPSRRGARDRARGPRWTFTIDGERTSSAPATRSTSAPSARTPGRNPTDEPARAIWLVGPSARSLTRCESSSPSGATRSSGADRTGPGSEQLRQRRDDRRASVVALRAAGHELVLTHGNGPQVGALHAPAAAAASGEAPPLPLDALIAMTQGQLGYLLADARSRDVDPDVPHRRRCSRACVVDARRPGVRAPDEAGRPVLRRRARGAPAARPSAAGTSRPDAGRGWRRVVPSPRPLRDRSASSTIARAAARAGSVVIAGGGGGIPVGVPRRGSSACRA